MTQKGTILSLTVKELEKDDGDTYTCDVGTARSTAKLTVRGECHTEAGGNTAQQFCSISVSFLC